MESQTYSCYSDSVTHANPLRVQYFIFTWSQVVLEYIPITFTCIWELLPPTPLTHPLRQMFLQTIRRFTGSSRSWQLITYHFWLGAFYYMYRLLAIKKMMMELLGDFKLPWLFDILGIRKINSFEHPHQLKFELSSWESISLLTILTSKGQHLFCSWAIGTSESCISSLSLVVFLLWGFGSFLNLTRWLWQPQRRWMTILAGL